MFKFAECLSWHTAKALFAVCSNFAVCLSGSTRQKGSLPCARFWAHDKVSAHGNYVISGSEKQTNLTYLMGNSSCSFLNTKPAIAIFHYHLRVHNKIRSHNYLQRAHSSNKCFWKQLWWYIHSSVCTLLIMSKTQNIRSHECSNKKNTSWFMNDAVSVARV